MFIYAPPANIDDLPPGQIRDRFLAAWHDLIAGAFRQEIDALRSIVPPLEPLFAGEVSGAFPADAVPIPVPWNAFPLFITRQHFNQSVDAWKAANELRTIDLGGAKVNVRPQDEYCEWFEYRTDGGVLERIVFTAEAPEYWITLAAHDIDHVVALYKKWVSGTVLKDELLLKRDLVWVDGTTLKAGSYDPYNKWNTSLGVMHLTHPANTLGAEIDLAARATVLRKDSTGNRITDVRRLACASNFGDPNRSSDPNIGYGVNTSCVPLAGLGIQDVTLANPVALYIDGLRSGTITGPGDEPLDDWFRIVRGRDRYGLMAILSPPEGAKFGLDQVKVKGIKLDYGGQVAEAIQMVLYAKVRPHAGNHVNVPMYPCNNKCCAPTGSAPKDYAKIDFAAENIHEPCPDGYSPAYPEDVGAQSAEFSVSGKDFGSASRPPKRTVNAIEPD